MFGRKPFAVHVAAESKLVEPESNTCLHNASTVHNCKYMKVSVKGLLEAWKVYAVWQYHTDMTLSSNILS